MSLPVVELALNAGFPSFGELVGGISLLAAAILVYSLGNGGMLKVDISDKSSRRPIMLQLAFVALCKDNEKPRNAHA
jgi:hypothetical protein